MPPFANALFAKSQLNNAQANPIAWPDQAAFEANAALARALDLIEKQQQRIMTLESEVQTDPLTGVLNQRGFYKALAREVDRANRQNKTTALLVLFDLDGLKQINDSFGHPAGDAYIKALAEGLASVRITDYVGRLGGDEFAILLTDAEPEAALARVARLMAQLNGKPVTYTNRKFPLAVSHGAITVTPGYTAAQLVAKADKSLYANKAQRKRDKANA